MVLDVSSRTNCDGIESRNKAIEFSMRNNASSASPWIPLQLDSFNDDLGQRASIRGYDVPALTIGTDSGGVARRTIVICGDLLKTDEVQFRWMGTANETEGADLWAIEEVSTIFIQDEECETEIFHYDNSTK